MGYGTKEDAKKANEEKVAAGTVVKKAMEGTVAAEEAAKKAAEKKVTAEEAARKGVEDVAKKAEDEKNWQKRHRRRLQKKKLQEL